MAVYLLLALAALLVLPPLLRRAATAARSPANRQQTNRILGGLLIALVLVLAVTGRLNWLFAAVAVAIPALMRLLHVLQYVPLLQRLLRQFKGGAGAAPRDSTIATRFLRMSLDHLSGEMRGEILSGSYAGRTLASLALTDLQSLLAELVREDPESVPLLEAYLDRTQGAGWRTGAQAHGAPRAPVDGRMSREEAYAVLGLEPGADREAILAAHRRLMQKLHPDRGGSTYLAAILNQAKDCLLAS